MRNKHRDLEDDLLRTWPPADENTMNSDGGDELVSAEVLLNEDDDDHDGVGEAFQCNTNPISSNEDDDEEDEEPNVANQTLWLHIKPEPCLEAEEVDLAMQLKLEKKRRRREKAEAQAEGSMDRPVKGGCPMHCGHKDVRTNTNPLRIFQMSPLPLATLSLALRRRATLWAARTRHQWEWKIS